MHGRPSRWWYALLALPLLGLMYPPLYARHDPEPAAFPFFYWYRNRLEAIVRRKKQLAAGALRRD